MWSEGEGGDFIVHCVMGASLFPVNFFRLDLCVTFARINHYMSSCCLITLSLRVSLMSSSDLPPRLMLSYNTLASGLVHEFI